MANNSSITIVGNIAREPELRFTPGGQAVCEIGVAVNERKKGTDGEWEDDVSFIDCVVWGQQGQNVSESCDKGTRIVASGRLKQDRWEKDGVKGSKIKLIVENIGVELRFATAEVVKNERADTSNQGQQQQPAPTGPAYDDGDV